MPLNLQPYNPNQIAQANLIQGQVLAQQQALQQQALSQQLEQQLAPYRMQEIIRQQQRQPQIDALNDQLLKIKIAEANKTPEQQLAEYAQRLQLQKAIEGGFAVPSNAPIVQQAPFQTAFSNPALTNAISQAATLSDPSSLSFNAPLGESAGIPSNVDFTSALQKAFQTPLPPQVSTDIRTPLGGGFSSSTAARDAEIARIRAEDQLKQDAAFNQIARVEEFKKTLETPKAQIKLELVRSVSDPKDIRYAQINVGAGGTGQAPEGYELLNAGSTGMKPSEVISAQREIRTVYDDLPSKIDYFGKGQVPGSNQLKTRLDAVLKPLNNDFRKLNPQAKQTFVFAINKLRDPTSATLLAEASQIAARSGIGDRFNSFIENYKTGDNLPDQVARDIYEVISQVHTAHKENLINSLIPLSEDIGGLGKKLTAIGVPADIQREVESRIESGILNTPSSSPESQVPPGMKLQRNSKTGETRLVPIN